MNERCFYMVWVSGGGAPTVQHINPVTANDEARRLQVLTGRDTFVLKAIRKHTVQFIPASNKRVEVQLDSVSPDRF
jgi:hypothetical protein